MAGSVSGVIVSQFTITEVLDDAKNPAAVAASRTVLHNQFNSTHTLNGSTSPASSKTVMKKFPLVAGALTLDLRSILGTNDLSVDANGLKVRSFKFINPSGNSLMTFVEGASNGYRLLPVASWKFALLANQWIHCYLADGADAVAAADKTIDITGTGTEEIHVALIFG